MTTCDAPRCLTPDKPIGLTEKAHHFTVLGERYEFHPVCCPRTWGDDECSLVHPQPNEVEPEGPTGFEEPDDIKERSPRQRYNQEELAPVKKGDHVSRVAKSSSLAKFVEESPPLDSAGILAQAQEPQPESPTPPVICKRIVSGHDEYGQVCKNCGHTDFVHGGAPNPRLENCLICEMVRIVWEFKQATGRTF